MILHLLSVILSLTISHSSSSADQPQLIIIAFEEGVENTGYFISSWSVSMRHRKGWWETRASHTASVQKKVSKKVKHFLCQSLIGLLFFSFLCLMIESLFLILVLSQRVIENSQWVEVLRKPPQLADVYLPSWPLRTHCARAWRVVVDPFNSTPQRKRFTKAMKTHWIGCGFNLFILLTVTSTGFGADASPHIVCLLYWMET